MNGKRWELVGRIVGLALGLGLSIGVALSVVVIADPPVHSAVLGVMISYPVGLLAGGLIGGWLGWRLRRRWLVADISRSLETTRARIEVLELILNEKPGRDPALVQLITEGYRIVAEGEQVLSEIA